MMAKFTVQKAFITQWQVCHSGVGGGDEMELSKRGPKRREGPKKLVDC